jgi:glycyl-tRNA synthetase beta chain
MPASLVDFMNRLEAVRTFRSYPEAESLAAANKRIRNILRKLEAPVAAEVASEVLQDAAEKLLLEEVLAARKDLAASLAARDYTAAMQRLAALRVPVDRFFDEVMVMAEDAALRQNRLGLLAMIEGLFLDVADISRLQG